MCWVFNHPNVEEYSRNQDHIETENEQIMSNLEKLNKDVTFMMQQMKLNKRDQSEEFSEILNKRL